MIYLTVMLALVGLAACDSVEELDSKYRTMPNSDFIDYFNSLNYTWRMKQYSKEIIINLNFQANMRSENELPTTYHDPETVGNLPDNFDARFKWPHCGTIREIYNQLHCGSCWTHGVANTASDRICIKHGKEVRLSEQDLECSNPLETICYGGIPVDGFLFWKNIGLVSRECKPYEPRDLNRNKCVRFCQYDPFLKTYVKNKSYAEEVYSIRNESYQIKAEIVKNGPIHAGMVVYSDFMNKNGTGYHSGIYEHKHGEIQGYHSVRVIGYGVENGVEYWLAANSWGREWGEQGLFRVRAFHNNIEFEDMLLAGIPK